MGNMKSQGNKAVEPTALVRIQREYRERSLMCFTETWLHQDIPDDNISIICYPNVELLAVGLRSYYLPREFSHVMGGLKDDVHLISATLHTVSHNLHLQPLVFCFNFYLIFAFLVHHLSSLFKFHCSIVRNI